AARELRLRVAAGVRLHARPGRVSNGHAVTFVGSLAGRPLPRGGKVIEMQVLIGRRWRTFATVRAHGRRAAFTYRYRFTRTYARVTYRFRALARAEAAYPYATGWSRTVSVRVNSWAAPGAPLLAAKDPAASLHASRNRRLSDSSAHTSSPRCRHRRRHTPTHPCPPRLA